MKYLTRGLTAVLSGLLINLFSVPAHCSNIHAQAPNGLADGPGVWINMWNYPSDPEAYCLKMHACGIRNIFIQTSRSNTPALCHPEELGGLLDCAHRYKMRVIAWSFAELHNPIADADKLIAAAKYASSNNEKVDAVAANLEMDLSKAKVITYSEKLKEALGGEYPLIAVVYSPLNHAACVATIPWQTLDKYYSVIAPMNYWHSKYEQIEPFAYTVQTIKKVRQLVGRTDVEVHVIGDGMGTHSDSIKSFLAACKVGGATSASLYPNQKMTDEQLSCIGLYPDYFAPNSRFRLASYRELVKRGTLILPDRTDPADYISRGQFYCLVLRQIYPLVSKQEASPALANLSEDEALAVLTQMGVVKPQALHLDILATSFLAEPIAAKEALDTMAATVAAKASLKRFFNQAASNNNHALPHISLKSQPLFVQPAFAESDRQKAELSNLSYLDAAQLVVQATPGIK